MSTMQRKSGAADTMRDARELTPPLGDSRALTDAAQTWFIAAGECQREMIGFVSRRLEKDGEAIRRMLTCGNPAEITAIQSRWVEETLRDYAAEMTRMMEIFARSTRGGVPPSGS